MGFPASDGRKALKDRFATASIQTAYSRELLAGLNPVPEYGRDQGLRISSAGSTAGGPDRCGCLANKLVL